MIHPWNLPLLRQLGGDRAAIPHALLLQGPAGVGKRDLGLSLAQWLLCEAPAASGPCGECDACNWFVQGNHPDFRQVEPSEAETEEGDKPAKKAGRQIKVEAVRAITEYLQLTPHRGGWRTALIYPAELMNAAAANALLKTLEEPPPRVLLILVAHQPGRLLATVRSRCRKVSVALPGPVDALAWLRETGVGQPESLLAEAGGAPLAALAYADVERSERRDAFLDNLARPGQMDACAVAQSYKLLLAESWGWLSRWLHDVLCQRLAGAHRYYPARTVASATIGQSADLAELLSFQRELVQAGRWLRHPLSAQLLLESWLIRYLQIAGKKS